MEHGRLCVVISWYICVRLGAEEAEAVFLSWKNWSGQQPFSAGVPASDDIGKHEPALSTRSFEVDQGIQHSEWYHFILGI